MGFLDRIVEAANSLGAKKEGGEKAVLDGVLDMVKEKGVTGIVTEFKTKGLGDLASSWIGKGENKPISTDQIKKALGNEKLQELATKAGISPENASKFLTQLLPNLIDRLTPEGQVPADDAASGEKGKSGSTQP